MTTKEKVLEILAEKQKKDGNPVSGEVLAEACGVSRAAVWKAVKSLREKGCLIEGTTNGGYVLKSSGDAFSQDLFTSFLAKAYPSLAECHVMCFSEIDSTNTYARRVLAECGGLRDGAGRLTEAGMKYHDSVIVAESQTAGKGRLGRTFVSPAKTGIYLSVIHAPEKGITHPARITVFSAVALCRVLRRLYGVEPAIKWINDIYLNGKKIAGILTEGSANFETGQIESAIIGIGINISDNREAFSPELQQIAGSITGSDGDMSVSRCRLAAETAGEVISILSEPQEAVIQEYKALSFLLGDTVTVHPVIGDDRTSYEALAVDIDGDGGLVVRLADGSLKTLSSGEVSLHSRNY